MNSFAINLEGAAAMRELKTFLGATLELRRQMHGRAATPYLGPEDFVLRHGLEQTSELGAHRGIRKQCFANAFRLAGSDRSLVYCEGFATAIIPVHHAWVCRADDLTTAIECTWDEPGAAYIGVPFNLKYVTGLALENGYACVLDCPGSRFPLLTGKHSPAAAIYRRS